MEIVTNFLQEYMRENCCMSQYLKWRQWRNHIFNKRNALKGRRLFLIYLTKRNVAYWKNKKNWSSDVKIILIYMINTSNRTLASSLLYYCIFGFAVCPTLPTQKVTDIQLHVPGIYSQRSTCVNQMNNS